MIVGIYHKLIRSPKIRKISLWICIIVSIFLIVFPFAVNPKVVERVAGKGHQSTRRVYENETEPTMKKPVDKEQSNSHEKYTISGIAIEVKGYMTLTDVAQKYNVPVTTIIKQLGIPKSALHVQTLGRLRKTYGFKMTDVEKIIYEYRQSH